MSAAAAVAELPCLRGDLALRLVIGAEPLLGLLAWALAVRPAVAAGPPAGPGPAATVAPLS